MPDNINIALFGASGKMGRAIIEAAEHMPRLNILFEYDSASGDPDAEQISHHTCVMLDFSVADAVINHVNSAKKARVPYVCGVTGLSKETHDAMNDASKIIPVLYSANMSPGMNVIFDLAARAAKLLPDYKRHIIETHHTQKKDKPSGTALKLADEIKKAAGTDTEITSLRIGDVVGEHRLIFGGTGEEFEITHRAESRAVFAHGALRAVKWIIAKPAGFYSMKNVLGL